MCRSSFAAVFALSLVGVACGGAIDPTDASGGSGAGSSGSGAGSSGSGAGSSGSGSGSAGSGRGSSGSSGTSIGAPDPGGPTTSPSPPPGTPPPANGPWGVWDLTGLDGPPGQLVPGPPPPMQLELRPDGLAFRWRCGVPTSAVAPTRCPDASVYECFVGKVFWDGARWRVDLPQIHVGGVPEQGEIVDEAGGAILIRYINPTYSAGHFQRIGEVSSSGSASQCKG